MPTELSAIMIKTTKDAAALAPSIHSYTLSATSATTRDIMGYVEENFPGAIGTSEERGAMLSPSLAEKFLTDWRTDIAKDNLIASGSPVYQYIDEMLERAASGHAMIFLED